jgi:hypothetical protein
MSGRSRQFRSMSQMSIPALNECLHSGSVITRMRKLKPVLSPSIFLVYPWVYP